MIIVPDGSYSTASDETIAVRVQKVFDGDGFLASAWNPYRGAWVERIPFRLGFIDAPEMDQPFGQESRDFLDALIAGRTLGLVPVLKGSAAPTFIDPYQRVLCPVSNRAHGNRTDRLLLEWLLCLGRRAKAASNYPQHRA